MELVFMDLSLKQSAEGMMLLGSVVGDVNINFGYVKISDYLLIGSPWVINK